METKGNWMEIKETLFFFFPTTFHFLELEDQFKL